MAERIAGSGGTPYMMYVNNSGCVPIAAYSGTTVYPLRINTAGELLTSATTTAGSESYIYGKSGTGWVAALVDSTGKLETTTSVSVGSVNIKDGAYVSVIQSGTPWGVSGTSDVLGSVAITNSLIQISGDVTISDDNYISVYASGTTGIPISGEITISDDAYFYVAASGTTGIPISGETTVTQATDPWIVLGSAQITNDVIEVSGNITVSDDSYMNVTPSGTFYSTIIASGTTGVPISGETTTTQGTDPWVILGSSQITNDVLEISGNVTFSDDSYVKITASGTTGVPISGVVTVSSPLEVEQARGTFGYSGATFIASGTVTNIVTPGTGSKILLKGFNASAETATQFRLLFSGGGLINTFTLPASGIVGMNMLGMEPSGATNEPIGAGLFNAGSLHLSVYTQDIL